MNLNTKLYNNKLTIGSWITIGNPVIVEIMATAGFEWLTIDMEHSAITLDIAQTLIITIQSKNIKALVRVGENNELLIKQVMDAGADGIIVPMVCSKLDAEKAVNAVKYPMKGKRGVGLARAQKYGIGFEEYKEWLNTESVIIAQIEHKKGVDNLNEITAVDGIDGIIIGPYDLSGSLSIPGEFEAQEFKDNINQVETYCLKNNVPLGIHIIKPDHNECIEKIMRGYTFIAFSLDFYFLGEKSRNEMKLIKENIKQ
jgi:2-dehydro-3-deoxyglucarate aldolase